MRENIVNVVGVKESAAEKPSRFSSSYLFSCPRRRIKKHKRNYNLCCVFVLRHDFSRIRDVWSPYSRVDDADRYSRVPDSGHVHPFEACRREVSCTRRFFRRRTNDQMLRLRHHIFLRVTFLIVPSLLAFGARLVVVLNFANYAN